MLMKNSLSFSIKKNKNISSFADKLTKIWRPIKKYHKSNKKGIAREKLNEIFTIHTQSFLDKHKCRQSLWFLPLHSLALSLSVLLKALLSLLFHWNSFLLHCRNKQLHSKTSLVLIVQETKTKLQMSMWIVMYWQCE